MFFPIFTNLVFKICESVCACVCVWLHAAECAYAHRGQERASDPRSKNTTWLVMGMLRSKFLCTGKAFNTESLLQPTNLILKCVPELSYQPIKKDVKLKYIKIYLPNTKHVSVKLKITLHYIKQRISLTKNSFKSFLFIQQLINSMDEVSHFCLPQNIKFPIHRREVSTAQ